MIQEEDAELGKQNGTKVKISESLEPEPNPEPRPEPDPETEVEYKVTERTVKTETETCAVLTELVETESEQNVVEEAVETETEWKQEDESKVKTGCKEEDINDKLETETEGEKFPNDSPKTEIRKVDPVENVVNSESKTKSTANEAKILTVDKQGCEKLKQKVSKKRNEIASFDTENKTVGGKQGEGCGEKGIDAVNERKRSDANSANSQVSKTSKQELMQMMQGAKEESSEKQVPNIQLPSSKLSKQKFENTKEKSPSSTKHVSIRFDIFVTKI